MSTTWFAGTAEYNVSMLGSISASIDVGYYRFLNKSITDVATLNDILQDLYQPQNEGKKYALHSLLAAERVHYQAIDILNIYIICGQTSASTRALLARVTASSRDAYWTVLMTKSITAFGISYLLNYFRQIDTSITVAEGTTVLGTVASLIIISGGIIDRLQDKRRAFSKLEAFLVNAFLALQYATLETARAMYRHSCFASDSLEGLELNNIRVDVTREQTSHVISSHLMRSHIFPKAVLEYGRLIEDDYSDLPELIECKWD